HRVLRGRGPRRRAGVHPGADRRAGRPDPGAGAGGPDDRRPELGSAAGPPGGPDAPAGRRRLDQLTGRAPAMCGRCPPPSPAARVRPSAIPIEHDDYAAVTGLDLDSLVYALDGTGPVEVHGGGDDDDLDDLLARVAGGVVLKGGEPPYDLAVVRGGVL